MTEPAPHPRDQTQEELIQLCADRRAMWGQNAVTVMAHWWSPATGHFAGPVLVGDYERQKEHPALYRLAELDAAGNEIRTIWERPRIDTAVHDQEA